MQEYKELEELVVKRKLVKYKINRTKKRIEKTGKNISFVIDFKDIGGASIFQNQYEKRKKMMKDCGVINIEKVQDFCKMIEELNSEIE